jgi:hypothetical protein
MSANVVPFPRPASPSSALDDEFFEVLRSLNEDAKTLWAKSKEFDSLMFRIRHKIFALAESRKQEIANG